MNLEASSGTIQYRYSRNGKLRIDCAKKDRMIPCFVTVIIVLTIFSLIYLDISWGKLISR